ncbi:MAG TPA: hypothetical protein VIC59_03795 [Gemmatimonadota bacterium]|jgi:hypothetical protein
MKRFVFFVVGLWLLVGLPVPAHAYLDPGSGSMLLQALLGGIAGVTVLVKLYWRRLVARFGGDRAGREAE